jgi:dihydroneopterin aldolase
MTDRIVLHDIRLLGRHGVHDWERAEPQRFEVDVELELDLAFAGASDDLARTVDYGRVYEIVRAVIEGPSRQLLETLATSIAEGVLAAHPVEAITVRVRKPDVRLPGPLAWSGVEIRRARDRG